MIEEKYVVELYNLLERNGIKIWLDGGWGIDALLGKQTRDHQDLDIAVHRKDVKKLRKLLSSYKELKNKSSEKNFLLEDDLGHKIDVHVFAFDSKGNNTYGILYPYLSLKGKGEIGGKIVNCISPEWVIKFHSYYEPKDKDIQDIKALCEKFGLNRPDNYKL